jgi:hypothetical protein
MARGTMHAAKPEDQRRRRNKPTHDTKTLKDDGIVRGPALRGNFDAEVREWHETWRRSPQAALFEETDWSRLQMLASIVQAYVRRPGAAALSEIRMNEERLGATVVDRMRARMVIERDDADAPLAEVVDAREAIKRRMKGEE